MSVLTKKQMAQQLQCVFYVISDETSLVRDFSYRDYHDEGATWDYKSWFEHWENACVMVNNLSADCYERLFNMPAKDCRRAANFFAYHSLLEPVGSDVLDFVMASNYSQPADRDYSMDNIEEIVPKDCADGSDFFVAMMQYGLTQKADVQTVVKSLGDNKEDWRKVLNVAALMTPVLRIAVNHFLQRQVDVKDILHNVQYLAANDIELSLEDWRKYFTEYFDYPFEWIASALAVGHVPVLDERF